MAAKGQKRLLERNPPRWDAGLRGPTRRSEATPNGRFPHGGTTHPTLEPLESQGEGGRSKFHQGGHFIEVSVAAPIKIL